ncbi:substrate-binding domain-containing protein [Dissulfurimicrobium hydrothermale]|uniref:substrate-binding domain-containing protein n=1 Tax=Dissulfurimicrobium hydrothermale TaxID=1750598 RepID=UPI001EDA7CB4|nr:phosphate/phosphite/phosphonate ABC transporter substrate-binding protein [Dissulfurimicrobium hydrothermale]UKL12919.1 phosphate/phosphite/phosphonate ABC transporter substrate-binding protein [Dissulfurimicrobium hydrothermale]
MKGIRCPRVAYLLFTMVFVLSIYIGCSKDKDKESRQDQEKNKGVIRLDKLSALPEKNSTGGPQPLRVAVAAIISPEGTVESYKPLLKYLGKVTERPVKLIQRRTYWEVNELIAKGRVDLAFVCTGAYIQQGSDKKMSLLVTPQIKGKVTYRAVIIVPSASKARTFMDLKGSVFAFTDPLSNTGYLYPAYLIKKACYKPEDFFKRTFFTYSHDRSIQAVAQGLADGASVDEIVYENAINKDPGIAKKIRIILTSQEFGMPPVVVPREQNPTETKRLKDIFLRMHKNRDGKTALFALGIEKFVEPRPAIYEAFCIDYKDQPCKK